ncbi:MAG TPA: hypothetical protein VI172_08235 [Candidatus Dormibacteraeota bacterium]|jgi:hypothetical protein
MTNPEAPTGLTKVSFNVTTDTTRALDFVSAVTGDSLTDSPNRAVEVYALVVQVQRNGGQLLAEDHDGNVRRGNFG